MTATPDLQAIRQEFQMYAAAPRRQEGDIDAETLAAALGLSINRARERMKVIAKDRSSEYTIIEVLEGVGRRKVLRPVKK